MNVLDLADIPLKPRQPGCAVPLTAWQQRVWNHLANRGTRLSEWKVCAASIRIQGALDASLLRTSIETVVRRHESLRTRFEAVDGIPRQQIDPAREYPLEGVDLTRLPPTRAEAETRRLVQQFGEEKTDLSIGPLFQSKLLRLSDHEHVLILTVDHMVSDLISHEVLNGEIWTAYQQIAEGRTPSLPQLPIQFADYAVWQQQTYDAWLKTHGAYWTGRLSGAPRIQFPLEEGSTEMEDPMLAWIVLPFGKELSTRLRDLARREQTLLALVILTVYAAVISRWSSQRDFVLTLVSHGRHGRRELDNMIGLLADSLYLRIQSDAEDSFRDLLKRASQEFHSAREHQDFGRVPDLVPGCATEITFNWTSTRQAARDPQQVGANGHLKMQPFQMQPFPMQPFRRRAYSAFRFEGVFSDSASGVVATVLYRTDVLAHDRMQRLGRDLRLLANAFVERPHASIASVALPP